MRIAKKAAAMIRKHAIATPIPMPADAPLLRPPLPVELLFEEGIEVPDDDSDEVLVGEGDVVDAVCVTVSYVHE